MQVIVLSKEECVAGLIKKRTMNSIGGLEEVFIVELCKVSKYPKIQKHELCFNF
jgi:hypothetical protein